MRRWLVFLLTFSLCLSAPPAFAYDCNNRHQYVIGPPLIWEYVGNPLNTSDSTCWSLGYSGPNWNSSAGLWEFVTWNDQTAVRTINVPSTDSGTSNWTAQLYIDWDDPNASWWNAITADVDVDHNGTHTNYLVANFVGNGGVTSYMGTKSVNFSAVSGDTITVRVKGRRSYTNTRVRFSSVHVWRNG